MLLIYKGKKNMLNDTKGTQYAKSRPALPNIVAIIYVAIEHVKCG